ncbi:hypothetical protein FLL69_17735 [Vibrio cholerae]|nr:hypothetical protein FLL69_17735 [Vibrio cholerae]
MTVLNDCSFKWSLSSLINLFDYHQRVPTQIDWFILLKSFSYRNRFSAQFARAAYITLIQLSVKRYFLTFSSLFAFTL